MNKHILETIKIYIEKNYLVVFGEDNLSFETDLFESGIFDSLALLNFNLFVKEKFGVELDGEAIFKGDINCVRAIENYISIRVS